MESIYNQFYQEARYHPSPITALRYTGGLLGRKTGAGFYVYPEGQKQGPAARPVPDSRPASVCVGRANERGHAMTVKLPTALGITVESGNQPPADALIVITPLGLDATTAALQEGLDATRVVAIDTLLPFEATKRRTLMTTPATSAAARGLFASDGVPVTLIRDSAGFIAQRIVSCIVNIASDIAQQRIANRYRPGRQPGTRLSEGSAGARRHHRRKSHPRGIAEHVPPDR